MADPVSVSLSLAQINQLLQTAKFYQRMTNDLTNDAIIISLQATLDSNKSAASPPAGMASAPAQSAEGVR